MLRAGFRTGDDYALDGVRRRSGCVAESECRFREDRDLDWNKKTAPHCYFGRGRRRTIIGGSNALTKEADPNDDLQSFEDKVASRVWELGRYTRSQI
jgi:hypothetical protein